MTTLESTSVKQREIAKKVYRAFFSPSRYEVKPSDRAVVERGHTYRIPFDNGELAVTTWGTTGPAILLMHGWGGARAQMTGFVQPLLDAGFRVVAYDQPAHGESDGSMTNLLQIAPTMDLVAAKEGPFQAVIAHSFGTLVTSYALVERKFPAPVKLVYFGSFNQLLESLPRFQVQANLSDELMDGFRALLYENFDRNLLESITNERLTPYIEIPTLMFHDAADNVTPVEDSRAIARVWTHVHYIETHGLGHRGALQSSEIHAQVVTFLQK